MRLASLSALVLGLASTAVAQESTALDEEARALYQAGRVAFDDGRFDDALEYFERAHELSGRPQLLFNIGSAADRLRRNAMALENFEAYLEALPDAENRRSVEARIQLLQEALDHGREHGTTQDPGTVPTPRETAEAGMQGAEPTGPMEGPASESRTGLWVGIGVGAAVLVGLAVVLGLVLRNDDPDYQPSDEGVLVFTLEQTP